MEETRDQHKLFFVSLFSILFVVFVILIGAVVMSKNNIKKEEAVSTDNQPILSDNLSPSPIVDNGSLMLKVKDEMSARVNNQTTISVIANSNGKPITGYDVIVTYDPAYLMFVNQTSINTTYTVYPKNEQGRVILTGTKGLNTQSQIFSDSTLMDLQFRPLKSGNTTVNLEYVAGSKKDSNLVDDQNKDVLGRVEGVRLTIQ